MKRILALMGTLLLLLAPAALAQDAPAFERTLRLCPDGAPLTFAAYPLGERLPEYPEDNAYRVAITRADGTSLPELRFACAGGEETAALLRFRDFNFDGYLDVEALYALGASNIRCTYFLYNAQADAFARCDALAELSSYYPYPRQKLINNSVHGSAVTGVWQMYVVENDQPRLLRQVAADYDEATDYRDVRVIAAEYAIDGTTIELLNEPVTEEQLNDPDTMNAWGELLWEGFDFREKYAPRMYYVNPEGGQHYHWQAECPTISEKYWPSLRMLDEAELYDTPYKRLTPCPYCGQQQAE